MKSIKLICAALCLVASSLLVSCEKAGKTEKPRTFLDEVQGCWESVPVPESKNRVEITEMVVIDGDKLWVGDAIKGEFAFYLEHFYQCTSIGENELVFEEPADSKLALSLTLKVKQLENDVLELKWIDSVGSEEVYHLEHSDLKYLFPDKEETLKFLQGSWLEETTDENGPQWAIKIVGERFDSGTFFPDTYSVASSEKLAVLTGNYGIFLYWEIPWASGPEVFQVKRNLKDEDVDRITVIINPSSVDNIVRTYIRSARELAVEQGAG